MDKAGGRMTDDIGILAYGSLMSEPGDEIAAAATRIIENVQTPFPIEFARTSGKRRGGAPTLVPVISGGRKVSGKIIMVDATLEEATDMLYRREIQEVGSGKRYDASRANAANRVRVKAIDGAFEGISTVLYTDLDANIDDLTPQELAKLAIESVAKAEVGKDGISYLMAAQAHGIRTALSDKYAEEILGKTGASSLEEALLSLQS
jgi:cation transport regulator ChaC